MNRTQKKYLALVISGILTTTANAESFRDALQGGKLSGDINNVLVLATETDAGSAAGPLNNANVGSSAITMKYNTLDYNGLSFGITYQYGKDWGIHDEGTGLNAEDDARNSINSTNLQNLFVDYRFDPSITNTSFRLGRQDIISPLIMRASLFPMKDAFDALVITNKDLSDTTIKMMYIHSWIKRYGSDAAATPVQQDANFDGSVYSVYFNNNTLKDLNVEGQFMSNNSENTNVGDPPTNVVTSGPYDSTFLAATYKIPNTKIILGAKGLTANFDNSPNSSSWGIKASSNFSGVGITLAYTSVDEANSLPGSLGHVPAFRAYAKTLTDAEFIAGVNAASLAFDYNFGISGLKSSLVYANWSQSEAGIVNSGNINLDGASELALDIKYKFKNVDGLSTRVQLSQMDYNVTDGESDMSLLVMSLKYQF